MKFKSIVLIVAGFALLQNGFAQPELTTDSIKGMCKRVASGRLNTKLANDWQLGTYFEGVMALYGLTNDHQYLDSTVAWGTFHNWLSAGADTFDANYDDICCYQAYLESYLANPTPAALTHIQPALDYVKRYTYQICPNKCGDVCWPIVDQYHMAAPSYPRAAQILNDTTMYDSLYHFEVMNANHHYNVKVHLFNSNCSDTAASALATRQWWGRGCGWGVCGTCRIHQYLPVNHPGRVWCEQRIKETCAKLITLQNQTDGMWRSELFTPAWNKEASGTGFFCYELFYALRNGIIDTATYLGPAKKAWEGLIGCVGVDAAHPNLPGWSQGVGGGPSNTFGPTNHDEYTEGAFLMAGNEFYKFLTSGITAAKPAPLNREIRSLSPAREIRCNVGSSRFLDIPNNAISVEFYTPAGRKICAINNLTPSQRRLSLSEAMTGSGVSVVKFLYAR